MYYILYCGCRHQSRKQSGSAAHGPDGRQLHTRHGATPVHLSRNRARKRGVPPVTVVSCMLRVTELAPMACAHDASGKASAGVMPFFSSGLYCAMRPAHD